MMNAIIEHRKYIYAVVFGSIVTFLFFVLLLFFEKKKIEYDDSRKELLNYSVYIMSDKISECNSRLAQNIVNFEKCMIYADSVSSLLVIKENQIKRLIKTRDSLQAIINNIEYEVY